MYYSAIFSSYDFYYFSAKEKEVERAGKWARMSESVIIQDEQTHSFIYSPKFKKRVYKGIPDCWRGEAWYYLVTDRLRNTSSDCELRSTYRVSVYLDYIF